MSKFKKNVLSVRKAESPYPGKLSLEAAGLSTILWENNSPDSPLFRSFCLSDLEVFMDVLIEASEEELQEVMDSLTSKGFVFGVYRIDKEGNIKDRVFMIQKLQQSENDHLSLKERAILQLLMMDSEEQKNPIIFPGFMMADMVTYLHIKFDIPVSKAINLIEELIGNGYVGKHELVKNLGDEPSTFCFMNH